MTETNPGRGVIYCPECARQYEFTPDEFVAHRTEWHPPAPIKLAVAGIKSREAHGYQPTEED
jgi:hypothetical protein